MAVAQVRLGDVLTLQRRKVTLDVTEEYIEVGLRSYGKGVFHKTAATGGQIGDKKVYRIEPGDLIVSNVFAWEGAVGIASDAEQGLIGSHRFMTWTPRTPDRVDARFLWHWLLSETGLRQLRRASPGTAGRNRTLAIAAFERIAVPLPEIAEQQRISARLDRVVEIGKSSEDLSDFVRTWRRLTERLTYGPGDRAQCQLLDVLRPKGMELVDPSCAYRIAGVYSFGRGLLSRGTLVGSETKYKTFTKLGSGNVVYSKLGAFEGAVAVVPDRYSGFYVSPEFPVFDVLGGVDPAYLEYCLIAESFVRQLSAATSGVGARQKRVSSGEFLKLLVPIPSITQQHEIASRLRLATQALELKNDAVRIRAALLPAARNEAFAALT